MEDPLRQEWLAAIIEKGESAIIVLDRNRNIRLANSAAARLAGCTKISEVIGESYDEILSQFTTFDEEGNSPAQESLPTYLAFYKGIETRDRVIEHVAGNKRLWLSISCIPLFNASGEVEYAIVYFRDISSRKLRADKLKFLLESAKILSLTTDFETRLAQKARLTVPDLADWCTVNIVETDGTLRRIVVVHRDTKKVTQVEELAQRSEQEIKGVGLRRVLETGKSQFSPTVTPQMLEKSSISLEGLEVARQLQVCSSMVVPIKSKGVVLGILSLAYAESGREYTPADLEFMEEFCHHLGILVENARLYEEIKTRDKAKDAFLATLSHELRNPLAPIKSSLELLSLKSEDPDFQTELSVIGHQFTHLTKLLNELLDVTRYTNGKIQLTHNTVDISHLIERIAHAHRPFITNKDITLSLFLPPEPIFAKVDETRIEQAITNIMHNAEKFTPEGGHIWISVEKTPTEVVVRIKDDGPGIDQSDIEKIFKGQTPSVRKFKNGESGLGIGLVLVREIINLHKGQVLITSEGLGCGSEFSIILPLDTSTTLEAI